MTHCCACGNAPLMFPLEKAFSVRWSVVYVCVCVCEDQPLDYWPVVISCCVCVDVLLVRMCVYLKRQREGESDGRKKQNERGRVRKCLRARRGEKRLIHTAGTVVASPASLALAAVRSDTSTVDTLLGAASC